jgi:hypothetical protein
MKNKLLTVLIALTLAGIGLFLTPGTVSSFGRNEFQEIPAVDSGPFNLKKGDILVRPNWSWLPGSFPVKDGGRFGHVAIVTDEVTENSVGEALRKTTVIEALFYDQATRNFVFRNEDQIR